MGVRGINSGVRVLPSLTVWCGVSYWTSLGLIFSVCKMGVITVCTYGSLRTVSGTVQCQQIWAVMNRLPAQSSMTGNSENTGLKSGRLHPNSVHIPFHHIPVTMQRHSPPGMNSRGLTKPFSPQPLHSRKQLWDSNGQCWDCSLRPLFCLIRGYLQQCWPFHMVLVMTRGSVAGGQALK